MSYLKHREQYQEIAHRGSMLSPRSRDQINMMGSMKVNVTKVLGEQSRNLPQYHTQNSYNDDAESLTSTKFKTLQMTDAQANLCKMIRSKTKMVKENITKLVEGKYAEKEIEELKDDLKQFKVKNQELELQLSQEKLVSEEAKSQVSTYQDKFLFLMQQTKILEDQVEKGTVRGQGNDDDDKRVKELEDELDKSLAEKEYIVESVTQLKKEFEKKEKSYQALIRKSQLFVEHKNKIKEKKQPVEQKKEIVEKADVDTPEFPGSTERKNNQDLINDLEKTIEDIKCQHKEELQQVQFENLEKLKEAQETVSQVQVQQQETMDRIEELQRELARKEIVASTIEDNQSLIKKNGDEIFTVGSESHQNDENEENMQGPKSVNSSPCKGTKNLTTRFLASENDQVQELKDKQMQEMDQLREKYEAIIEEQRIGSENLMENIKKQTQEKIAKMESVQNALYLAQVKNNKEQVVQSIQTESNELLEMMVQTDMIDSEDKSMQTDELNDNAEKTQTNAPIETKDLATDKGDNFAQTKGQDVIELNSQLASIKEKMDRQQKVNGWLMDMMKEKGMMGSQ